LAGVVRDLLNGKPVKKARVSIRQARSDKELETDSDEAGRFIFQTLSAGRYNLQISPRGFWPEEVKDLLIPRENGVYVEATVLRRGRIVACQ
jgi:hypothetical protein